MDGTDDIAQGVQDCESRMKIIRDEWPGQDGQARTRIRAGIQSVLTDTQFFMESSLVTWSLFSALVDISEECVFLMWRLSELECASELSRLEAELKRECTAKGWEAYLRIDSIRADRRGEAACCCPNGPIRREC